MKHSVIFKLQPAYDAEGNSPWDTLWCEDGEHAIEALECQMRLASIWKSPRIRIEKRKYRPDIYGLYVYSAVPDRVRQLLLPLVNDTVEFLPISASETDLFILHPLERVDLDDRAEVTRNKISGNITVVREYSFRGDDFEEMKHVFQVRQAVGSCGRDGGFPCSGVLISESVKKVFEANEVKGVAFKSVFQL